MEWTSDKPIKEGWYYRKGLDGQSEIVNVRKVKGELRIWVNMAVSYPVPTSSLWAGPIPEPNKEK